MAHRKQPPINLTTTGPAEHIPGRKPLRVAINLHSGNARSSDYDNVGRHFILLSPSATKEGVSDPRRDKVRVTGLKPPDPSHEKMHDERAFWIRLAILERAPHADRHHSFVTATAIAKKQLAANPPMIGDAHQLHIKSQVAPEGQWSRPKARWIRQVEQLVA